MQLLKSSTKIYIVVGILAVITGLFSKLFPNFLINAVTNYLSPDKQLLPQNIYYLQNLSLPLLIFGLFCIFLAIFLSKLRQQDIEFSETSTPIENIFSIPGYRLVLVSVIILYFELFLIRYLGQQIRILAYFKNIILICAFLGIGIGCGLSRKKTNFLFLVPILLYPIVFLAFAPYGKLLGSMHIPDYQEYFCMFETTSNIIYVILFFSTMIGIFSFVVFIFVPLGKSLGELMDCFKPLIAYSLNIAGSILGIILFTLLSYIYSPPWIWLLIGFILWLLFVGNQKALFNISSFVAAILIFGSALYDAGTYWSPYYRVDVVPVGFKEIIDSNGSLMRYDWDVFPSVYSWDKDKKEYKPNVLWGYQAITNNMGMTFGVDYSDKFLKRPVPTPFDEFRRYELLFRIRKPKEVLILGAGFGSEVASAIRNRVDCVEGVEIDPMIAKLSYELHPERPYQHQNAHLIVDDARAFISKTKKNYDLIQISALDSHVLLSGMSSNRLDSFVYTYESFRQIKNLLKDDGIFSMTFIFASKFPWIMERLEYTMRKAFPNDKIYTSRGRGTIVAGPGVTANDSYFGKVLKEEGFEPLEKVKETWGDIKMLSDNWPYIYLKSPNIPSSYLVVISFLLLLSFSLVKKVYSKISFSPHFFFLGAGFLLLETKSITELGILFGSTWIVNSFVFAIVLLMILCANLILNKYNIPAKVFYIILFLVLAIQTVVSPVSFLPYGIVMKILLSFILYGLPFLCAAFIFGSSFKTIKSADYMLGANLIGSILGGSIEYGAIILGIKSLNIVTIIFYLLSLIFSKKVS